MIHPTGRSSRRLPALVLLLTAGVLAAGCTQSKPAQGALDLSPDSPLTHREGEVVSYHPDQGYVVVKTDGHERVAWWDHHTRFWQNGAQIDGWDPTPGLKFHFRAFDMTGELYMYEIRLP